MEPPKTWVWNTGFLRDPSENPQPPESPENAFRDFRTWERFPRNSRGVFGEIPKKITKARLIYHHDIGVVMLQKVLASLLISLLVVHPTCGHDPTPTKISPSCAVPADVVAVLQVEDGLGTCNASRNSTATWLEHAFLQGINGCLLHISKLTGGCQLQFSSSHSLFCVLLGFRQNFETHRHCSAQIADHRLCPKVESSHHVDLFCTYLPMQTILLGHTLIYKDPT